MKALAAMVRVSYIKIFISLGQLFNLFVFNSVQMKIVSQF